jgi:hypothetical protein
MARALVPLPVNFACRVPGSGAVNGRVEQRRSLSSLASAASRPGPVRSRDPAVPLSDTGRPPTAREGMR